jgi:hypothetical protein
VALVASQGFATQPLEEAVLDEIQISKIFKSPKLEGSAATANRRLSINA